MSLAAAAVRLARALPDLPEAAAAAGRCSAPWRVAVVGRRSAGKTTLINRLAGTSRAVGLGGVTTAAVEVPVKGAVLVDTPGLGGRGALDRMLDLVEHTDAVIWVVDGLHPLTLTERRILREGLLPGTDLRVVVTHLDLVDPDDVPDVLARVRGLTAPLGVTAVSRVDLRSDGPLPALVHARTTSPARRRAVRRALDAAEATLDAQPEPALARLRDGARAAWADAVGATRTALERDLRAGLVHKGAAVDRLRSHASDARDRAAAAIAALDRPADLGLPDLPVPAARQRTFMGEATGGWAGEEGARRVLRAHVARWLADGHLRLEEWLEGSVTLADEVARRAEARAAIAEARAGLAGGAA